MSNEPSAKPLDPDDVPDQIERSGTGAVMPGQQPEAQPDLRDGEHRTGERQAKENAENDPPA